MFNSTSLVATAKPRHNQDRDNDILRLCPADVGEILPDYLLFVHPDETSSQGTFGYRSRILYFTYTTISFLTALQSDDDHDAQLQRLYTLLFVRNGKEVPTDALKGRLPSISYSYARYMLGALEWRRVETSLIQAHITNNCAITGKYILEDVANDIHDEKTSEPGTESADASSSALFTYGKYALWP